MKKERRRLLPANIIVDAAQETGSREEQQDYYAYAGLYANTRYAPRGLFDVGKIAIVADGMGGYEGGKIASSMAAESFIHYYQKHFCGHVNRALIDSMHYANKSVITATDGGTTLVCAVIDKGKLYWLTVGDSRLYLYRNGLLRLLNIEHNYKNKLMKMVRTGELSLNTAMLNKKKNALTSYIGLDQLVEYDYNDREFPILKKDKILLCSDGLYKALNDSEIAEVLSEKQVSSAKVLVEKVLLKHRKNQDNVTALILNVE